MDRIHLQAGTILGTSRGPVDKARALENLIRRGVNILFTIGGDGTQQGTREFFDEAKKRGYALPVVGIPKTIDNDIPFVARSFGFLTAVEEATQVLQRAHTEARSVPNGIALVRLMGRHAGFLTAEAAVASQEVNFALVPEVPFGLEGQGGFRTALEQRMARGHAVIAAPKAQDRNCWEILERSTILRETSGCVISVCFCARRSKSGLRRKIPFVMRHFDPSYIVRSSPCNAEDAVLCDAFAKACRPCRYGRQNGRSDRFFL